MKIICKSGDVLDEEVDVLISSGNIYLNLSGGVGGEILHRGGRDVQAELHRYLKDLNVRYVAPGTVVKVKPGPANAKYILYTVAIDVWYNSSVGLVAETIQKALKMASDSDAKTVALPALATGYGHLKMEGFANGLKKALAFAFPGIEEVRVVLKNERHISTVETILNDNG